MGQAPVTSIFCRRGLFCRRSTLEQRRKQMCQRCGLDRSQLHRLEPCLYKGAAVPHHRTCLSVGSQVSTQSVLKLIKCQSSQFSSVRTHARMLEVDAAVSAFCMPDLCRCQAVPLLPSSLYDDPILSSPCLASRDECSNPPMAAGMCVVVSGFKHPLCHLSTVLARHCSRMPKHDAAFVIGVV